MSGEKPWGSYEATYIAVLRDHQTIYEPPDFEHLLSKVLMADGAVHSELML